LRYGGEIGSDLERGVRKCGSRSIDWFSVTCASRTSGAQLAQTQRVMFHFRRAAFFDQLQAKVGSTLSKVAALRINLNIDGTPITSRTHTHPSPSEVSRLLTSSLSFTHI
jgi:hypothetical protein